MESDAQLVAQAQGGDEEAFAELVRRHQGPVFRLTASLLGRAFLPEAEEVAQEVFLKAHHALPTFRGEAAFGSWLYRIAYNQALNLKARVRYRDPHLDDEALTQVVTTDPGPHAHLEEAQRDAVIAACIRKLPDVYQSTLHLYYWMGASVSEVALLLEVPENTVKSYLHRSRQLLHGHLKERGIAHD